MFRMIRWAVPALMAVVFTACGGGGGGSSEGGAPGGTGGAVTDGLPPPLNSSQDLAVLPGRMDLLAFIDSGLYQAQNLVLTGRFRGDGVIIGFAPNVSQPSWLGFTWSRIPVIDKTFEFEFTMNAASLQVGNYSTFLRVAAADRMGAEIIEIIDVPITLRVVAAPPVYNGTISLAGRVGMLTDVRQTVALDFDGRRADEVSATLRSDMGDASEWLAVAINKTSETLTVQAVGTLPVGLYRASVQVAYTIQGAQGMKFIPVQLEVTADAPIVYQSSPGYMVLQDENELVLRGYAFDKAQSIAVSVGGVAASQVQVVNDTEVRAWFSASPGQGDHGVRVTIDGTSKNVGALRVLPRIDHVQQDIQLPCSYAVADMVFDPSRGNIIAICDDTYYLLSMVDGVWSIVRQRQLTGLGHGYWRSSTLLTADQKYLVTTGDAQIILLDPVTLETLETRPIPVIWHQSAGYGFLSLEGALNSGKLLLTISGMPRVFYVYDLHNRTLTVTEQDTVDVKVANRQEAARALSTLQLVYVKTSNRSQAVSADPSLFTVTFMPAPPEWQANYVVPTTSADGRKMVRHGYGPSQFELYNTVTLEALGGISSSQRYDAASARFTAFGDELCIIEGGQGRLDVYAAVPGDVSLRRSATFTPYNYYAAAPKVYITPDDGAVIMYSANAGNGVGAAAPLKVVPLPRAN